VVPRAKTRKALSKASTDAAVEGIQIYGPHAVGLVLFAIPVMLVGLVAHNALGVPSGLSISGTVLAIGLRAAAPALMSWLARTKTRKDE
jgi:hypothetical protein